MDSVVTMDKSANPGSVLPAIGQASTFTLSIETYTFPLSGATVRDTLPSGWAYVPGSTTITLPSGAGNDYRPARGSGHRRAKPDLEQFFRRRPPDPAPLNMPPDATLTIVYQAITTAVPPQREPEHSHGHRHLWREYLLQHRHGNDICQPVGPDRR